MSQSTVEPGEYDLPELEPGQDPTNAHWAEARQKSTKLQRDLAAARDEIAANKREVALRKAGVNPEDPQQMYFAKAYDGELTTEAIIKAATEAGLVKQPADLTDEQKAQQQQVADAQQAIVLAGDGATLPEGLSGTSSLEEAMKTGGLPAMLRQAEKLGIPVIRSDDGQ